MDYTFEQIDELIAAKLCDRCKISKLLHIDCMLYTNLGLDSTKKEKQDVKAKSKKIYTYIKKIDSEIGDRLLSSMDQ
jgi:hypothetical protein